MKINEQMKNILFSLILLFAACLSLQAQERVITGTLTDRDTKEVIEQATVQLLRRDSTYVKGTLSNEQGEFRLEAPEDGAYIVKITNVGYLPTTKRVEIKNGGNVVLGRIVCGAEAIMLKGTTVTAQARKVVLKEDTFVYNSSAYRTPEGSAVEELVKRLPGAEVSDDGTIKINGKEVKKIKVDGKEFMTGDTKTALKNLPTSIINQLKVYDEKSDLSRVTGIDDGNEETVLDFGIKPGMNHGLFVNADAAVGTRSRYSEKLMGAYFKDDWRVMLFGSANNTNDQGFPGGGGFGRFGAGRQGLNATKMLGTNLNYEKKDTLKVDGSIRWNHNDADLNTLQSIENFVSSTGAFTNSRTQQYSRGNSWDARLRLEWTPDSLTNIMFRPSFSYSASDSRSEGISAAFNSDPYEQVDSPLSEAGLEKMKELGLLVNTRSTTSITYSTSKTVRSMLQYNRRLNAMGRNITFRVDGNWGNTLAQSLSTTDVHLFQATNSLGLTDYQTNRYNYTPTRNWGYSLKTTYSEPLWRATFLQFGYTYNYSYSKSDRSTFDFSELGEAFIDGVPVIYRGWAGYLSRVSGDLAQYRDEALSRYSEYRNYTHELEVMMRFVRQKYNLNFGVMLQPQRSHFTQDYQGLHTDTTRTVTNFSPTLDFRYRFNKVSNLRINYRGTTSQPGMTDLLDITDDSDPLNIRKGNPGLKPSFTNRFRLFYNTYIPNHQQAIMTFINYSNTRNAISDLVTYDESTGGRTTRPENINGNWDVNAALMYNTSLDTLGYWNINTFTRAQYNNYVAYLADAALLAQLSPTLDGAIKNRTRSTSISERIAGSYRNSWLELALDGSFTYTSSKNKLQSSADLNTWQFAYGGTLTLTAPWGTQLNTSMHMNSRRGYNDASLNTNELVWNAQLSQGFLRGKPLTVSLQFYDILDRQSNLSRSINATQRTDTEYNAINSYAMLHVIYRMNLFGSKDARQQMHGREGRPDFGRPEFRGGQGGRPGGGGGFRPRSGGFGGPMMID